MTEQKNRIEGTIEPGCLYVVIWYTSEHTITRAQEKDGLFG